MAVKTYKPTTPSRRNMTSPSFAEITKFSPEKSLVVTTQWNTINVYDILNCNTFIVAKDAVAKIEEVYAR